MEKFTVSVLIGAPPGYVGYEKVANWRKKVRRNLIALFIGWNWKGTPDIYNILLQVLDDGQLTDGLGRKVDFKNSTIIMTSNIWCSSIERLWSRCGLRHFHRESKVKMRLIKQLLKKALKRTFSPEFLNRIDDVVIFNSLTKEIFSRSSIFWWRVSWRDWAILASRWNWPRMQNHSLLIRVMMFSLVQDLFTGLFKISWRSFGWGDIESSRESRRRFAGWSW